MLSIWTIIFPSVGRYHWLLQYYLKSEGITLGWVGTGKLLFSHNFSDEDFKRIAAKIIRATRRMQEDNWFWAPAKGLGTLVAKELTKALWRPQSNQ
jgi:glutamate-1-semialdehyde 2,1-aminomutase